MSLDGKIPTSSQAGFTNTRKSIDVPIIPTLGQEALVSNVMPPNVVPPTPGTPSAHSAPVANDSSEIPSAPRSRSPRLAGLMSTPVDRPRVSLPTISNKQISKNAVADMTTLVTKLDQEIKEQETTLQQKKQQLKELKTNMETVC